MGAGLFVFFFWTYCKAPHVDFEALYIFLIVASCLSLIGTTCEYVHFYVYSTDGKGIAALEVISLVFTCMASSLISFALVCLSYGWYLTFSELDWDDYDLVIPIGALIILLHGLLGGLQYLDRDDHFRFHDNIGVQAIILICFKAVIYIAFIIGICRTSK